MNLIMALWILFAFLLFVVCAVLLVIEIFVPSFGLITVFALSCLAGGIAIFFRYGPFTGWIGVITAIISIPTVWIITYRIFPRTRFGRHIILANPKRPPGDAIPDTPELESMLGSIGIVTSPLRPVGMCDFNGKRIECVAETAYIEKDKKVKVIHVEGTQLTVRLTDEN
jgi:membrane-bound serine protease (ClpP class)